MCKVRLDFFSVRNESAHVLAAAAADSRETIMIKIFSRVFILYARKKVTEREKKYYYY